MQLANSQHNLHYYLTYNVPMACDLPCEPFYGTSDLIDLTATGSAAFTKLCAIRVPEADDTCLLQVRVDQIEGESPKAEPHQEIWHVDSLAPRAR